MATVTQTTTKTKTLTIKPKPKQKYGYHRHNNLSPGRPHKLKRVSEDQKPLVKHSSESDEEPFFHRGTYIAARYGRTNLKNKSNGDRTYVIDDLSDDEDLDLIMPVHSTKRYHMGSCCSCTCSIL
ncbi:hypothetical protein LOD99_11656 [Oopsacas minuta]|uniref:Uncharacterized protein n=1 Tax=Oopsacas minuta TaxID=111878 RepID=A0AAV7JK94_9METZ|nr:hypothetical protein LOD99_11656 [Oopsacas minuta]